MSSKTANKSKPVNAKVAKVAEVAVEKKAEPKAEAKVEKKTAAKAEKKAEVKPVSKAKAVKVVEPEPEPEVEETEETEEVEPEQPEETEEVEETEEETKEDGKKKKASKLPNKSKVVAKTTKGKGKNGKVTDAAKAKQHAKDKKNEEARYKIALSEAAACNYVTVFDELSERSVHDKLGQALTMHILETIDNIQRNEVTREGDYNPFPSELFFLYEDKLNGMSKKKAAVKTKGAEPTKQKTVMKRGERAAVVVKDDPEEEPEEEPEADEAEPVEQSNEEKAPARKNITSVTKNGKTYLGFIIMRFVDEIYTSEGGKTIKNSEDFAEYVFKQVTQTINSHISRVIVATTNRLRELVGSLQDRGVEKLVSENINMHFKARPSLVKFIAEYSATYLKLLGHSLGHRIWVSKSGVNPQSIESVMRSLDFGNHEYMIENKYITEEDNDFGLSHGVLQDMRMFEALLNPGPTEEEKKARAEKRKAGAGTKGKGKGKAKGKTAKAATKRKSKKAEVEEPEEEQEEAVEEVVEEQAEEEQEEQAEEEAVEEQAEEEAVEEQAEEEQAGDAEEQTEEVVEEEQAEE